MTGNEQSLPAEPGAHARQEHAEGTLRSLELFGMRFGLDRMRRMMTVLGSPERSFEAVHVLGTNGKSSTTRMTAAILERHGLRTGAYLSPHLVSYRERVLVGEQEMDARRLRRRDLAGGLGGRAGQPHARRGRPRDAVRTADGGRLLAPGRRRASRWPSWRPGWGGATTPPACSTPR